jgi:hypothetical protein
MVPSATEQAAMQHPHTSRTPVIFADQLDDNYAKRQQDNNSTTAATKLLMS